MAEVQVLDDVVVELIVALQLVLHVPLGPHHLLVVLLDQLRDLLHRLEADGVEVHPPQTRRLLFSRQVLPDQLLQGPLPEFGALALAVLLEVLLLVFLEVEHDAVVVVQPHGQLVQQIDRVHGDYLQADICCPGLLDEQAEHCLALLYAVQQLRQLPVLLREHQYPYIGQAVP